MSFHDNEVSLNNGDYALRCPTKRNDDVKKVNKVPGKQTCKSELNFDEVVKVKVVDFRICINIFCKNAWEILLFDYFHNNKTKSAKITQFKVHLLKFFLFPVVSRCFFEG